MASNLLPVHISTLSNADAFYEERAGKEFLKVGGDTVMGSWLQLGRPSCLVKHPGWGTVHGENQHMMGKTSTSEFPLSCPGCDPDSALGKPEITPVGCSSQLVLG